MNFAVYSLKIFYHFFLAFSIYETARYSSRKTLRTSCFKINLVQKKGFCYSIFAIVFLCLLEGLYSFICGPYKVYLEDRAVYAQFYSMNWFIKESSIVLYWIETNLRNLTANPDVLFFVVAFIYMLFTCIALNCSDDFTPFCALLLGLSQYTMFGCYQLKQALAAVFTSLSIIFFIKKKRIPCLAFAVLGVLSHETALIIVPIILILTSSKSRIMRILEYFSLIIFILLFTRLNGLVIALFSNVVPSFAGQISMYLSDTGSFVKGFSFLNIFKGFPFYAITIFGFLYRKEAKNSIPSFEKYLMVSFFVSISYIASIYMRWLWRFGELFYIVDFIFAGMLFEQLTGARKQQFFLIIIPSLTFFTLYKLLIAYWNYGGIV